MSHKLHWRFKFLFSYSCIYKFSYAARKQFTLKSLDSIRKKRYLGLNKQINVLYSYPKTFSNIMGEKKWGFINTSWNPPKYIDFPCIQKQKALYEIMNSKNKLFYILVYFFFFHEIKIKQHIDSKHKINYYPILLKFIRADIYHKLHSKSTRKRATKDIFYINASSNLQNTNFRGAQK